MPNDTYSVKNLLKHPAVTIDSIHLAPGHKTPRHSHAHDYVVHPRQDATLTKVTYEGDAVVKTETVEQKANVPYLVPKTASGQTFEIVNDGGLAMNCEKVHITK